MTRRPTPSRIAIRAVLAAAVLCAGSAQAQYKWVAPDGTVTYGDKPPVNEVQASRVGTSGAGSAAGNSNLPYALRNVTDKYPVALYTTPDCKPCDQARSHLSKRGVPFIEKTVKSNADTQAMAKLGLSDGSFPAMTVGRQKQIGYEQAAFDGLLDNAGYPKTSLLPPGYRPAEASKLASAEDEAVAAQKPAANSAHPARQNLRRDRNNAAVQTSSVPSAPSQENPTGLRF